MATITSTPTTKPNRTRNRLILGAVAGAAVAALAAGGAYWWQDRQELSQASAEDCRLAQRIVTEGARIAAGPAPEAEQWWKETGDERRATMEDGYLGAKISRYEGWALETAKNPGGAPSAKDVKNLQEDAQGHCVDSGVTLALPPLGS
ncbi:MULTISPECIES: hypothetical protein [Streptomyces]|uniref:Secreted protein n=1 Tax=Streptomyces thermodiastaticus TaxID=44061 RepID=A0ABU0KDG1_9ACTN|nr:hypothetical protein [Streptomyces thermodiastaticus]MXQ58900.1 hypothetical protein [Streptomyces sp. XHT-2]MYQ32769.1 hypothetical protein [Streptomyces sp. SID4956]THC57917.1 hypothetical protein E7X38_07845 [Streptomyces sp. Akac8]UVT09426.1 hypothetical protein AY578_09020 [Streptomyces thermocarboxydus]WSB41089.1 hypothetical protein OG853_09530 [Streptomyces cellulosae]